MKVHSQGENYKDTCTMRAKITPQYEITSDKTGHIALHKAPALKRLRQVPS